MDEETKKSIESIHTMITELSIKQMETMPSNKFSLKRYRQLVEDKESHLNEMLSIEVKERKLNETMSAIESVEFAAILNDKDDLTGKLKFSNEAMRKTELVLRINKNPDYIKAKSELEEVQYRKKNLINTQSINRSWRKYHELVILSETKN